jgi:hypothetical protein
MPNYVRNPAWADGASGATPITAAKLNNIESGIYDAHFQPCVRVYHSVDQSTTSGTFLPLAFDTERFDTDAIHDAGSNTRLTCKTAGRYQITANIRWASNATGICELFFDLNATTTIAYTSHINLSANIFNQSLTTLYDLAVNDYVRCCALQNSGGAQRSCECCLVAPSS